MKRHEIIAALVAFVAAACASGIADPLIDGPIVDPDGDAGVVIDASTGADGSAGDASVVATSNDGLPVDAVVFTFATSCPLGFTTYQDAIGRFALGAETDVGTTSSATPFGPLADPVHSHLVSGTGVTADVSVAGSTGSGGTSNANSDDPAVSATSSDSSLGIPYIQLRACRKTVGAANGAPELAQGSVIPFSVSMCPTGFAPLANANGRFVAGLPVGGTNDLAVGGAAMTSGESFVHGHSYTASFTVASRSPHLIGGSVSFAQPGNQSFTVPAANVSTTLPFVRLLYCEKL